MNVLSKFLLLLSFTLAFSASAEQLKLKSDPPDATIYIRDLGGIQNVKIGVTPFEGNLLDLASNYAKSNFFLIVIEKVGYESQSILLSDLLKSDIKIEYNLIYFKKIELFIGILIILALLVSSKVAFILLVVALIFSYYLGILKMVLPVIQHI